MYMENRFIRADDVAQELNVSKPYATMEEADVLYGVTMQEQGVSTASIFMKGFTESERRRNNAGIQK